MKVTWQPEAEEDLVQIGVHTWERWGEEQFDRYHGLLVETCEQIIPKYIRRARSVPQRPQYLRWRYERHVIYFKRQRGGIVILRILHESQTPEKHL